MFEIGNSLREARERQKLELPEIERATHIRSRYLAALEEERFDVLSVAVPTNHDTAATRLQQRAKSGVFQNQHFADASSMVTGSDVGWLSKHL